MQTTSIEIEAEENGKMLATFNAWLYGIVKSGFGFITMQQLKGHQQVLKEVFDRITYF